MPTLDLRPQRLAHRLVAGELVLAASVTTSNDSATPPDSNHLGTGNVAVRTRPAPSSSPSLRIVIVPFGCSKVRGTFAPGTGLGWNRRHTRCGGASTTNDTSWRCISCVVTPRVPVGDVLDRRPRRRLEVGADRVGDREQRDLRDVCRGCRAARRTSASWNRCSVVHTEPRPRERSASRKLHAAGMIEPYCDAGASWSAGRGGLRCTGSRGPAPWRGVGERERALVHAVGLRVVVRVLRRHRQIRLARHVVRLGDRGALVRVGDHHPSPGLLVAARRGLHRQADAVEDDARGRPAGPGRAACAPPGSCSAAGRSRSSRRGTSDTPADSSLAHDRRRRGAVWQELWGISPCCRRASSRTMGTWRRAGLWWWCIRTFRPWTCPGRSRCSRRPTARPAGACYASRWWRPRAAPVRRYERARASASTASIGDVRGRVDTLVVAGGDGVADAAIFDRRLRQQRAPACAARPAASRRCAPARSCSPRPGLLDGRRCHHALVGLRPAGAALPRRHASTPTRSSCATATSPPAAGVTAGMDLALALVEEDHRPRRRARGRASPRAVPPPTRHAVAVHRATRRADRRSRSAARRAALHRRTSRRRPVRRRARPSRRHERTQLRALLPRRGRHDAGALRRASPRRNGASPARRDRRRRRARSQRHAGFGTAETMRRTFLRTVRTSPNDYRRRFRSTAA